MYMYQMRERLSWMTKVRNSSSLAMITILKGYKLYNPNNGKILINWHVIFYKEKNGILALMQMTSTSFLLKKIMVCLLASNRNENSRIEINDVFTWKIKAWNGNQNSVGPTNLGIITRVMIPKGGLGNHNSILGKWLFHPQLNF